jgi:hypothetical protein
MKIKHSNLLILLKGVKIKDISYLIEKLKIEILEG